MAEHIVSPRLRNSSINGTQFSMELDPVVKKHLTELDRLLSAGAFTEKKPKVFEEVEKAKKDAESAAADATDAMEEAEKAENDADTAEFTAAASKEDYHKVKTQLEELKKSAPRDAHEIKRLEAEEATKATAATSAEKISQAKRANAEAARNKLTIKQTEAENASNFLMAKANEAGRARGQRRTQFDLEEVLEQPVLSKKTKAPFWDANSFLGYIVDNKDVAKLSISDCIDKVNELSNLKNSLQQYVNKNWNSLDENQKAILNFKNVSDYLLAYGYWIKGITEVSAIYNFIKSHKNGTQAINRYTVQSSSRAVIKKEALEVKDIDNDANPLLKAIEEEDISFGEETFSKEVKKVAKNFIANGSEMALITEALKALKIEIDDADLPSSYLPSIIKFMRSSKVVIDEHNINYFLPIFINKIRGEMYQDVETPIEDVEATDEDFDVEFIEDEKTTVKTNVSNVKCASQLFSAAIMDMELDVFNLTNYLTNSYLIRNRIDLEDQRLRQNLQQFVFSNRFTDVKSGQTMDRTKEGERQHFYRQVFNIGSGPVPDGVIVNHKFPRLWKQLIPAVKDYLENAASSLSENTFVSKGGVMQVVSGLQNNLSANCTSMAKIISPIINAEWNFIISKILGHPEIIRQVSPAIGSWKGVAETLYGEMKHKFTDATLVYDKVRLSNAIIRKIAEYEPRVFEEDETFMEFCSMVIQLDDLNNSIVAGQLEQSEDEDGMDINQYIPEDAKNAMKGAGAPAGNNDWDF